MTKVTVEVEVVECDNELMAEVRRCSRSRGRALEPREGLANSDLRDAVRRRLKATTEMVAKGPYLVAVRVRGENAFFVVVRPIGSVLFARDRCANRVRAGVKQDADSRSSA